LRLRYFAEKNMPDQGVHTSTEPVARPPQSVEKNVPEPPLPAEANTARPPSAAATHGCCAHQGPAQNPYRMTPVLLWNAPSVPGGADADEFARLLDHEIVVDGESGAAAASGRQSRSRPVTRPKSRAYARRAATRRYRRCRQAARGAPATCGRFRVGKGEPGRLRGLQLTDNPASQAAGTSRESGRRKQELGGAAIPS